MAANDLKPASESPAARVLTQIEYCLRQKCVICIEHTPCFSPSWSSWRIWGKPDYYNGNANHLYSEIDHCRVEHADHYIRLNIEDPSCHCRFSFVVHSPSTSARC